MPDEQNEREPATETADLYERHGKPDPSKWDESESVTDRPNDLTAGQVENSTLASRASAAAKAEAKEVKAENTEDKAVAAAATKSRSRKAAK